MFYVHKYLPTLISLINVELGINVEGCKSCQITKHALLLFEGICGHWNGNYTLRGKVVPEGWAVTAQPSGTTLIRKAKWVKFIGCVFKSSLYQQKESRVFLIFSAHINIEVAPNCLAL